MRDLRILCVGRIKEDFIRDGITFYLKKIRKSVPIEIVECPDEPTPEQASVLQEKNIRRIEGERMLRKIREEDYVIALCIDGKQYDTPSWASRLQRQMRQTSGSVVFVIGGSLGLSEDVIRRADDRISFSAMTFPHQMMRMILCEQIAKISLLQVRE